MPYLNIGMYGNKWMRACNFRSQGVDQSWKIITFSTLQALYMCVQFTKITFSCTGLYNLTACDRFLCFMDSHFSWLPPNFSQSSQTL